MNIRRVLPLIAATSVCISMAACSVRLGFVDDSSSEASSRRKSDNSIIAEILNKGYSSTDSGEEYSLDGDFAMLELYALDSMNESEWKALSDDKRYETALNFLNFWAYYGDDASIRFKPSELVSGITDTIKDTDISVLDAALSFAVPASADKYLVIIGIIDIEDTVITGGDDAGIE